MNRLKIRVSDNVLEDKDWTTYELEFEIKEGVPSVSKINSSHKGAGVYIPGIEKGMTAKELSKWSHLDTTGEHPETYHEIWVPHQLEWNDFLTEKTILDLIGS